MSRYGSADVGFLLADGQNILSDMTNLEDEHAAVVEETTALGDAAANFAYVGNHGYKLTQNGFYNDAANRSNAALVAAGQSVILSYAPEGNALGKRTVNIAAVQVTYKRKITHGELHKVSATYEAEEGVDHGVILIPLGEITADGDTEASSYDGTAQSTAGGTAYLQVTALTLGGYDDVVVTVLDDADNSGSFGSLVAFDAITTAPQAQRKEVSGTVERYLAVGYAFSGSGSSPSLTFTVSFRRN